MSQNSFHNKFYMKKLLIFLAVLSLTFVAKAQDMPEYMLKLMYTSNVISRFYVDETNNDKISEAGVKAMLKELDPHSTYTDPKETKALLEQMQGSFSGIGIQFNVVSDTLYVIQTTKNGPSERVGLLAGDKIITVNDTLIAGGKMERADRNADHSAQRIALGLVVCGAYGRGNSQGKESRIATVGIQTQSTRGRSRQKREFAG